MFSIITMLLSTVISVRDYQDTWILEGIEIPFLLFIASTTLYFYFEKDDKWILFASITARMTFIFIPSFKYVFFQGRSIDQFLQLSLVNDIIQKGNLSLENISTEIITLIYYASTPFLSITLGTYSIFLNVDSYISFKIIPIILNITYPIFSYIIVERITIIKDKEYLIKILLFFLAMPNTVAFFLITGSTLIYIFTFLLLYGIIKLVDQSLVSSIIVLVFFIASLFTHTIYTIHNLFIFMGIIMTLAILKKIQLNKITYAFFIFLLTISFLKLTTETVITEYIKQLFSLKSVLIAVPGTFISLIRADIFSGIITILFFYGTDLILILLLPLSFLYIYKNVDYHSKNWVTISILIEFLIITGILTVTGLILGIGFNYWERVFRLSSLSLTIPASLFILSIKQNKLKKIIIIIALVVFPIFSTIQFFQPPNILPKAIILNPTLNENVPIMYNGEVNSAYQRSMIEFASSHITGRLATDAVTRNQFLGLTSRLYFHRYITFYYPPSSYINNFIEKKPYQYIATHLPGVSGSFEEVAVIRDSKTIINLTINDNSNLIYSNSESLISYNLNYTG